MNGSIESGKDYTIRIVVDEKGLDDAIGIELVTLHADADGQDHVYSVEPLKVVKREGDLYTFEVVHSINNAGSFKSGLPYVPAEQRPASPSGLLLRKVVQLRVRRTLIVTYKKSSLVLLRGWIFATAFRSGTFIGRQ